MLNKHGDHRCRSGLDLGGGTIARSVQYLGKMWRRAAFDPRSNLLFDGVELACLAFAEKNYGLAGFASTPCASRTMDVRFNALLPIRKRPLNYKIYVGNVDTARSHVGRNQNAIFATAETSKCDFARSLIDIAVQNSGVISHKRRICKLITLPLRGNKHDRAITSINCEHVSQNLLLRKRRRHDSHVRDGRRSLDLLGLYKVQYLGISHVLARHAFDPVGHGGREQHHLLVRR
mmetsp:Transcript_13054/g.35126  ORF Transcript_13054/g.35126 Transcript_13054/m.35126 type:complete len:233 (+) Transcript_13054:1198-1896(+)